MSKHQILRDLVYERLTLAAEEIFALVERTIADYEYELCRCREESSMNQQRLDLVLSPRIQLHQVGAAGVLVSSPSPPPPPDPALNLEIMQTAQMKDEPEEQSIKKEREKQQVSSATCVKSEEPLMLLETHPELLQTQPEETQEEDVNPELDLRSQTEEQSSDTDYDVDLGPVEMETHGDHCDRDQITEMSTDATGRSKNNRKHQCSLCSKTFRRKMELQRHIRVHTGERPYTCTVCTKTFSQNIHLKVHMRTHSHEKPYSCSFCAKTFTQKIHLDVHLRIHSGERPYRCHVCPKTFTQNIYRLKHVATHSEAQQND